MDDVLQHLGLRTWIRGRARIERVRRPDAEIAEYIGIGHRSEQEGRYHPCTARWIARPARDEIGTAER